MRKRVRLSATEVGLLQAIERTQGLAGKVGRCCPKTPARDRLKRLRLIESQAPIGYIGKHQAPHTWHLTDQGRKVVEAGQCNA